jgi:hypothetical protein
MHFELKFCIISTGASFPCDYLFVLQDEAGTAAIKTVELDAVLGGRAIQHRELQGYESDKFLSYFKPCIIPLEGGFASGFKKPEEEKFETRLYICRGKRAIRVKEVWKIHLLRVLFNFLLNNSGCCLTCSGSLRPVIVKP